MLKQTLQFTSLLALSCSLAQADTLSLYNFDDSYASTDTELNTTSSDVVGGVGLNPDQPVFSSTSITGKSLAAQHLTESDQTNALAVDDYVEFTISLNSGVEVDYTSLDLFLQRSNNPGSATTVFLRSSFDGYLANLGSDLSPTTTFSAYSFDLSSLVDVTDDITFRIYGYGGANTTSSLRIDDLTVSGNVTAVPETSSIGLLLGAGALFIGLRQRKQ